VKSFRFLGSTISQDDFHTDQSELLKKDFNELFETLKKTESSDIHHWTTPARGTNRFSRLLGLMAAKKTAT